MAAVIKAAFTHLHLFISSARFDDAILEISNWSLKTVFEHQDKKGFLQTAQMAGWTEVVSRAGSTKRKESVDVPLCEIWTDKGKGAFVSVCEKQQEHVRKCIIAAVIHATEKLSEGLLLSSALSLSLFFHVLLPIHLFVTRPVILLGGKSLQRRIKIHFLLAYKYVCWSKLRLN